ncbi:hypothetical protein ACFP3I_13090 [Chryseobacterium arachidis]|uniref:hypothetical protein n=1 Tax=Chryseobacterium arachidis TaxID=1416778 RepID=UPI003616E28B
MVENNEKPNGFQKPVRFNFKSSQAKAVSLQSPSMGWTIFRKRIVIFHTDL